MSRHVSPDRKQHVFKLPGIHLNNRVANPVSDFRRADPPPEHRQTQSLPLPRHNGYLVTSEPVTHDRMTYYHSDTHGGPLKADNPPTRRQKSLPSRRPRGHEERGRQANSAPSRKQRAHSHGAPLPKLNTLVARSRGPTGETNHIVTTNFAGFSTKDHEISHQKSTRFATNWAQIRAENHIDICASPDSTPRAGAADENKPRDRSPSDRTAAKTRQQQGTSPDRNRRSGDQQRSKPDVSFHATSRDKENVKPENSTQKKEPSPTPASVKSTQPVKKKSREEKGKQTIRFVTPDDERAQKRQGDDATDGADVSERQKAAQESQRSKKKRSQWDSRLTQAPPQHGQPTVTSWRRYEAELSHVPAVTSTEQVYKAYTGRTKEQLRDEEFNAGDGSGGHGKPRPVTTGSSENDDGGDEPEPRSRKEHILTRNEAKMYIHIQNVYGSEAFRQQRKQWFFKKLTDVQLQELKQQAEERRLKQQRKEESKRRQQRQLAYVRRKFRRQQLHRFRTQYVTSRVLEYEKADRDLYGLPDSDDEDGSGNGDAATDSGKNSLKAPSPDSSNKKGPKGDGSGVTDTSNKGKATEKKESSKRTGGDQNAKGVTSPGARTQPTKAADAPHKPVGTERDSSTKVTDSETHAPLNKSSRHEPFGDQFLNNRRETSNSVRKSKQMDSKAAAIKDTHDVNNRALPPSNAVGTSDPSASKTLNTTPLSRQAKNTVHTKDSNNAQPSSSNNAAKNGHVTKDEESLAKDLLSDTEPNTVKEKRGPEQAKASKNTDPNMSSKSNAADALRKTTTNNEPDKHSPSQKASETPFKPDKSVKHPATSTAKDPAPATKSTTANDTQAEPVSSSKPESPAEKTAQVKSKPAVADSNGLPSRARNHSAVEDSPGKRTTITKDAKGRYFTTTRTFGSQDPPSNAKPSKSSPRDRVVNGHDVPKDGKGTRHASAANRHSDSRGRKHKKTHAQPKSEAEQKKQLERKYGKLFDVNTGPTWNPSAKPPKMEGIDTVYVRVTDDKGRTKLKRREVKDVVKEAKNQLAVPDQDSRGRRADAKGSKPSTHTGTVRPASADTLDFDDDDDEDTEDVFERVRRKYNLQIDSDDDDISRL